LALKAKEKKMSKEKKPLLQRTFRRICVAIKAGVINNKDIQQQQKSTTTTSSSTKAKN
jgi:hypothetical protein